MRRTCKVLFDKEEKANRGKDGQNDRYGYLDEHIREECKSFISTFGVL